MESSIRQKLVVFTGAGISVESGLPLFRFDGGLWQNHDYVRLSTAAGFEEDPENALAFYNALRNNIATSEPNHAHQVIAELEKCFDVTVLTQNIDNLHERAGSSRVIHMHGTMTKVTSSLNRLDPECIQDYPLDVPIKLGDKARDGSQLRPAIVLFGEFLSDTDEIFEIIKHADIFVVIGTSLKVYPASIFVEYAHPEIPKFLIDPSDFGVNMPEGFKHIRERATAGVDILRKELMSL